MLRKNLKNISLVVIHLCSKGIVHERERDLIIGRGIPEEQFENFIRILRNKTYDQFKQFTKILELPDINKKTIADELVSVPSSKETQL